MRFWEKDLTELQIFNWNRMTERVEGRERYRETKKQDCQRKGIAEISVWVRTRARIEG